MKTSRISRSAGLVLGLALLLVGPLATPVAAKTPPAGAAMPAADAGLHPLGANPTAGLAKGVSPAAKAMIQDAGTPPASVDLSTYAPAVGDQGQVGSCVSWATGYYYRYWLANNHQSQTATFAPMYLYSQISQGSDYGSTVPQNVNIMYSQGIAHKSDYTHGDYDYTTQPTTAERTAAAPYKVTSDTLLFGSTGSGNQTAIQTAMAAGQPVVLIIPVWSNFDRANSLNPVVDVPSGTDYLRGWHGVFAAKYDATGVWIENSWGTSWGAAGWGELTWAFINQRTVEGWTISDNGISLSANPDHPLTGQTTTITASVSTARPGSYLVILSDTNAVLASCASGTVCTATASSATATSRAYHAVIGTNTGGSPVATSATLTVTWTPPWSVTLRASNTTPAIGQAVTLTATASRDVGPTIYYLMIVTSNGTRIYQCGSGTSCSVDVSLPNAGSATYYAKVGETANNPVAVSSALTVTWGGEPATWTVALQASTTTPAAGSSVTLTATASADVSPYSVVILDGSGTVVDSDGASDTCVTTVSTAGGTSRTYHAVVGDSDGVNSIQATSAPVTVTWAAPPASLSVSGFPSPSTAGVAHNITVSAKDAGANVVTDYRGTVHFTSSDPAAVLPNDYTFTLEDAGTHAFNITLKTAGAQSLTATDAAISLSGSQTGIVVTAAAPATLSLAGLPSPFDSGSSHAFTVSAQDAYGNTASTFRGTVQFVSSDPAAVLPDEYAFGEADAGAHSFSATLKTVGSQSVTATDSITSSLTGSQAGISVAPPGNTFHAIAPARVLDTRASGGLVVNMGLSGTFVTGTVRTFAVANARYVGGGSAAAVPAGATAVTGNLTIVGETAAGVVALGPTVSATGEATTINFVRGDVRANNVTVGLSAGGTLQAVFRSSAGARTNLIFDVTGYFTPDSSGATYHPVAAGRVLDTRSTKGATVNIGLSGKFTSKNVRTFSIAGVKALGWASGLVPAGATAVTGNITVTNATSDGYVSVGPTMASVPSTSTINVKKGVNCANGVTVALSSGKLKAVWVGGAGSSADLVFDVTGYFTANLSGLMFHPVDPVRLLNSATGKGLSGRFATNSPKSLRVGGVGMIPADAAGIAGNLTVVGPSTAGWAQVAPTITKTPSSSTVNAGAGQTVANGFDVPLSAAKLALIWVGGGGSSTNLQLDVTGYWK